MLTEKSKKVLDDLIANYQNAPKEYNVTRINEIYSDITESEFVSILDFLAENEYITYKIYMGGAADIVVTHKGFNYQKFEDQQKPAPIFHINNAHGSVIGTQQNVTLNYTSSLSQLKDDVDNCDSEDKESLQKIVSLLEMIIDNQVPPSKGIFSKFSAIMERNSWFTSAVSSTIMGWLMTQIS